MLVAWALYLLIRLPMAMLSFIRSFLVVMVSIYGLAMIADKVRSWRDYGKPDGTSHLGECRLPEVSSQGGLLEITEKGVTRRSCVLYVRTGDWRPVQVPKHQFGNCAINGFGYAGRQSTEDIEVEKSFWVTKRVKELVCVVIIENKQWMKDRSSVWQVVGTSLSPKSETQGVDRAPVQAGFRLAKENGPYMLEPEGVVHWNRSVIPDDGFTEASLAQLLRRLYAESQNEVKRYHGSDIRTDIVIAAYLTEGEAKGFGVALATIKASERDQGPVVSFNKWRIESTPRGGEARLAFGDDQRNEEALGVAKVKHGLTEEKRRDVWSALELASRRAKAESGVERFKYTRPGYLAADQAQAREEKLSVKYQDEVRRKYRLTKEQAMEIINEGIQRQW